MSRIRANQITNENANGAPNFPHGFTHTGIITSTAIANPVPNLTVNGNLGLSGTLTSEDVTNEDSIGIVTARTGVKIGPTAGVGATIFTDGSINSAGIITSTNVSVASSVTAVTYFGDGSNLDNASQYGVLEHIAGQCDGSTRTCNFGTFTFANVTSSRSFNSTTYASIPETQVAYKPPAGATGVEFIFHFSSSWTNDAHAIQHFRFYIDNTEVTGARFTTGNRYYENLCSFRWYFRIGGSGNDYTIGRFENWNSTKTFDLRTRAYQTSGNTVANFYRTYYWEGTSGNQFRQPQMEIIAYGNPAV